MKGMVWILTAVVLLFWGIPLVKYTASRLWVYARVWMLRLRKGAFVVFRHPFSLWAFHRSKHADMMVVCDRCAYLVKFGGSFKRATYIEADTPASWRLRRFWRAVGPVHTPRLTEVFTRKITIPFDLTADTARFKATLRLCAVPQEVTAVYMLTPKPLGVITADGVRREVGNGDMFFGMTLFTAKRFFKTCRSHGDSTLSKAEKKALKAAFRQR